MERLLIQKLLEWKNRSSRLPLLLYGARQVGKTYLLQEFGARYFQDTMIVNFEVDTTLAREFSGDIDPTRLINTLEIYFNRKIDPDTTLIVLDEIQASERALTSLKYFAERAPQYHIVAAGSLLGVSMHRSQYSFPVGKVEMLTLYPMDFEEFLLALNETALVPAIRDGFSNNTPLPGALHAKALDLYKTYLVVGGMPAAVKAYVEQHRVLDAAVVQQLIVSSYVADMAKYATPTETTRVMACFDSIPAQLAKDNHKFMYKVVKKGGSATLFGPSIDWLTAAGMVLKCTKIEQPQLPLSAYVDLGSFKLYLIDTGLLVLKSGLPANLVLSGWENSTFLGAITENYAAQCIATKGYPLFYWESNGVAEVDFLIQQADAIIPVEIKASDHTRSRSLALYRERYKPPYAIRVSQKNFGLEQGLRSVPLYALFCL
ncbi:MAG TPA: ATP-binding protein [Spirochaetales bacterium]|nr:ATP-binding protein [Spirochaetales bacterium]